MKKVFIILILVLMIMLDFGIVANAYYEEDMIDYITDRIIRIRQKAYNTNTPLPDARAREYAEEILYWTNYYSKRTGFYIDPLIVTAIIEAETNFVSRDIYDNGTSIGVSSMKIATAKDIARELNVDYNKWRMLDATDLGIRFTVHYIARAYEIFDGDLERVVVSYNRGYRGARIRSREELQINYLFRVENRYNYYQQAMGITEFNTVYDNNSRKIITK